MRHYLLTILLLKLLQLQRLEIARYMAQLVLWLLLRRRW